MNILLADPQPLTHLGIHHFLTQYNSFTVYRITTVEDLLAWVNIDDCILFVDPYYSDDFSIDRLLTVVNYHKIIIISNPLDKTHILGAMHADIPVYLTKSCQPEEILKAIEAIQQQKRFFCSRTIQVLFDDELPVSNSNISSLTAREVEIVRLIAKGHTDKQIAGNLFLSFHTIRTHRKNICKKLGFSLKNAAELIWLISYFNDLI